MTPPRELVAHDFARRKAREQAAGNREAGTVYLCHPFLVHAGATASRHASRAFMAQPPCCRRSRCWLDRSATDTSPVEAANPKLWTDAIKARAETSGPA